MNRICSRLFYVPIHGKRGTEVFYVCVVAYTECANLGMRFKRIQSHIISIMKKKSLKVINHLREKRKQKENEEKKIGKKCINNLLYGFSKLYDSMSNEARYCYLLYLDFRRSDVDNVFFLF